MNDKIYDFIMVEGKKLCPICLNELNESSHINSLPVGKVILRKENYALIKVKRNEPVVTRMLKINSDENDDSEEFIIIYVNKKFAGYKGNNDLKLLFGESDKKYSNIVKNYLNRVSEKKNGHVKMWNT